MDIRDLDKCCSVCHEFKELSKFRLSKRTNKYNAQCLTCEKRYTKQYKSSGRCELVRKRRIDKDPLKHRFKQAILSSKVMGKLLNFAPCNSTIDDLKKAWTGKCHLCGMTNEDQLKKSKKWLAMDHCHTTGNFRAFLCIWCNLFLGQLERYEHLIDGAKELIIKGKIPL